MWCWMLEIMIRLLFNCLNLYRWFYQQTKSEINPESGQPQVLGLEDLPRSNCCWWKQAFWSLTCLSPSVSPSASLVTQRLLPEEPRSRRLMTSDQDTKVVAEPQVQQVQEAKENAHLVSFSDWDCAHADIVWLFWLNRLVFNRFQYSCNSLFELFSYTFIHFRGFLAPCSFLLERLLLNTPYRWIIFPFSSDFLYFCVYSCLVYAFKWGLFA